MDWVQNNYTVNQRYLADTRAAIDQADLTAQKAANEARDLEDVS